MNFTEFIKPELIVLVVALAGLGVMLKNTKKIKDNYIPVILTVVGVALSCLYVLGTEGITAVSVFTAIVQGVICTAVSVYGDQIYKQLFTKNE